MAAASPLSDTSSRSSKGVRRRFLLLDGASARTFRSGDRSGDEGAEGLGGSFIRGRG